MSGKNKEKNSKEILPGTLLIAKKNMLAWLECYPTEREDLTFGWHWHENCAALKSMPYLGKGAIVMYLDEIIESPSWGKQRFGWKVLHNGKIIGLGLDTLDTDKEFFSYSWINIHNFFDVYNNLGVKKT